MKKTTTKLADGTARTFYYHRATKTRLPDDPNSVAFKVALETRNRQVQADRGPKVEVPTIGSLIRAYQAAPD